MSFADRNVHKLHQWLVRLAGDGGGRVSLGHLSASGPGVPLGQWAVRQQDDDETLRQLAEAIVCAAADDTDGQAGGMPQQYVALFYLATEPDKAASRMPFRLAKEEQFAPEGSALASEPPTDKGLLSQAIRHNEFLVRTSFGAMGSAASQLERHNHMMSDQLVRLTEQVFEMQRERQELLDRDAERLLEIERFDAQRKHRDRITSELFSAGKGFLAMAANRGQPLQLPVSTTATSDGGGATAPVPASAGEQADAMETPTVPAAAVVALDALKDFFKSLTPEQVQSILTILTPTQQATLYMLSQMFAADDADDGEDAAS